MNIKDIENEYGAMKITKTEKGEAVIISYPGDETKKAGERKAPATIEPPEI